jgi:WD40 repeat protein
VVRFSPDGKTLAAAGYEAGTGNAIYRFDVVTGKELPRIGGELSGGVRRLVFSADGKHLITAGFDGYVRIWEAQSGKPSHAFKADCGTVYGLALSPDGKRVATASREGLRLWETANGQMHTHPNMNKHECVAVCFSPDGKLIASGDAQSVILWEVATGKAALTLSGFKGELSGVLFSRDGRTLYTASYDKMIRLWEVRTGRLIRQAEAHTGWIWALDLRRDDQMLVSGSVDGQFKLWHTSMLGEAAHTAQKLSPVDAGQRWKELSHPDPAIALRAVWELSADPTQSLPLLREKLASLRGTGPSLAEIHRLIAELDHEEWPNRESASKQLLEIGPYALSALKTALEQPDSPEARKRLTRLIAGIDPTALPPEDLLVLRGIQTLETIGTTEARAVLQQLARSASGSPRLIEEATQAVRRLARSTPRP